MAEHNMSGQNDDRDLDQMMDSLLSNYSAVEPRPGLEIRVLANLRVQDGRRHRGAWMAFLLWGGAAAVLAVLVLMAVFSPIGRQKRTLPTETQRIDAQEPSGQARTATKQESSHPVRRSSVVHRDAAHATRDEDRGAQDLPIAERPAMFPTPVALSEQERLMFAYLENTPKEEVIAQIQTDDAKEAQAFWEDRLPTTGPQRLTNNR